MLFVSGPGASAACGGEDEQNAERAACVRAIGAALIDMVDAHGMPGVALAQALPEPTEHWAIAAYARAGFTHIGELAYLRRPLRARDRGDSARLPALPVQYRLRSVESMGGLSQATPSLGVALERSYIDTLDCPGLCGLRATRDVIESHRATGVWDPGLWFVLEHAREGPMGALLLNPSPENGGVELVYLGLAPGARGQGIARELLAHGIAASARTGLPSLTCAVDRGNTPAMRLYERFGFVERGRRVAFVARPADLAGTPGARDRQG